MCAVCRLALVAVLLAALYTAVHAWALSARQVEVTPRINWSMGLVLLELPQELFPSGTTGIYVSNVSDCSVHLPTWWDSIGGLVYVLFNAGKTLEAGMSYTWFLCYGDIIVPKEWGLFQCDLPGACSINYTAVNATLTNTSKTVKIGGTAKTAAINLTDTRLTSIHVYYTNLSGIVVDSATVELNTTYRQNYLAEMLSDTDIVANTSLELASETNTTDTVSYDTGTHYYDTGVVTIYETPYPMYARKVDITINVYDSDRNTYYVCLYINGEEVSRWYQQSTVTYTAYNLTLYNVSVRVYDTERNVYVRAWGTVSATYTHYLYRGSLGPAQVPGRLSLRIRGDNAFTADGDTATVTYYEAVNASALVRFNTSNGFLVVYKPRLSVDGVLVSYNYTAVSAREGASWSLTPGEIVLRGDDAVTYPYDSQAELALAIDTAAVDLPTYGQYGYQEVALATPQNSTLNITVALVATPGTYNLTWQRLLVADALVNYTVLVGSEYMPSTASSSGATAGNATVVVNVENPYARNYWLAAIAATSMAGIGVAVYLYIRGWRTNRLDYSIYGLIAGLAASVIVFALGEDRIARLLLFATIMLMVYSVAERLVDIIISAAKGRVRKPF